MDAERDQQMLDSAMKSRTHDSATGIREPEKRNTLVTGTDTGSSKQSEHCRRRRRESRTNNEFQAVEHAKQSQGLIPQSAETEASAKKQIDIVLRSVEKVSKTSKAVNKASRIDQTAENQKR